jgi:hypothetical protein
MQTVAISLLSQRDGVEKARALRRAGLISKETMNYALLFSAIKNGAGGVLGSDMVQKVSERFGLIDQDAQFSNEAIERKLVATAILEAMRTKVIRI